MRNFTPAGRTILITLTLCIFAGSTTALGAGSASSDSTRLLDRFLAGPMADVERIVFAARQGGAGSHWYENFGYYAQDASRKVYRAMGQLCSLNIRTGRLRILLDDKEGSVRDPQVHYDGRRILFSYRKAGSDYFNLYEINSDGSALKQLTRGPYDDIEPTYLSDGSIMFCSSRCKRWVNCWYSQVAVLYRCDGDGSNISAISANIEHDNTPWPLPDGRVLYQRWEYVDRSRVAFQHLWTCNPDGTGQMVFYGNMHPDTLMIDAKPIPNTDNKVVAIFSPGHGKAEHTGAVTIITPKSGPDDLGSARKLNEKPEYRDPWAFSQDCFLVAKGPSLLVMNARGQTEEIFRLAPALVRAKVHVHEPRPLIKRKPERIIPSRIASTGDTGKLILTNVRHGRRMEGVKPGEITKLLVIETLPKPVNFTGKMPPISFGGTFTLVRILGTVPVESDGSAYMELPAKRPLFFVALDKNDNSVKRMHSFLTVMPGETTSCLGCHEQRTRAPMNIGDKSIAALKRPAQRITPIPGIPEVFDYPRDIQPILDKHCLKCHDYDKRSGRVILTGDRGPIYSHSYYTLTVRNQQVIDGRDRKRTNLAPRSVGTSASRLMKKINGSHHDVKLSAREQNMIRYWIEAGVPYPGTYAALGTGMIGGFPKSQLDTSDRAWPESKPAAEAIRRRCLSCHDKSLPIPRYISDNLDLILSNPSFDDIRCKMSRHIMFNLTRPEKSLILLAPLSRSAGGYALCRTRDKDQSKPATVFADANDPDYQKILAMCTAGRDHLEKIKRFDMPGFRPIDQYVREMQRFGIITDNAAPIDVYRTDRAY
ncbi:MAG: PD40 domain-containing protein, partial [Phycisphaerae bacterium]|nr:PD40 domain-containing protein [Phycisphaerae bacterium]